MKTARTDVLDPVLIGRFRKDVLQLAKATGVAKNRKEIGILRRATRKWSDDFGHFGASIREDLEGRIREAKMYLEHGYKSERPLSDPDWAKWYINNMKPFWDLQYEVGNLAEIPDLESRDGGYFEEPAVARARSIEFYQTRYPEKDAEAETDAYYYRHPQKTREEAEQEALAIWQAKAEPWAVRVRFKALKAWKYLADLVQWTSRDYISSGGGKDPVSVTVPEEETLTMEGFHLVFRGYEESSYKDRMEALRQGLHAYRQRAAKVLPILLQKQLPMVIEWVFNPMSGEEAASYHRHYINVTPWALTTDIGKFVEVAAHEMGHHLFQTVLTKERQDFWNTAIRGNYGPLDLREALKVLDAKDLDTLDKELAEEDPILFLQLGTLRADPSFKGHDLWNRDAIRKYVETPGNNPVFPVPSSPITGYAGKNAEEAFCEAVGRLVAYGPMVLPETVKEWLRVVIPSIRTSAERVADKWSTYTGNDCDPFGLSWGWIDPSGKVYRLSGGVEHESWAKRYLKTHLVEWEYWQNLKKQERDMLIKPAEALVHLGWLRVTTMSTVTASNNATPAAWNAMADLVLGCVSTGGLDPDTERILIGAPMSSRVLRIGVIDFVEKYKGRKAVDQMFEALLSKKAAAETPRAPDHYFKPGDLILHGKFQNKPGQIVRIFEDERGIPMVEVAPVGHPLRKNRVFGLYRIRHAVPAARVASAWFNRTAGTWGYEPWAGDQPHDSESEVIDTLDKEPAYQDLRDRYFEVKGDIHQAWEWIGTVYLVSEALGGVPVDIAQNALGFLVGLPSDPRFIEFRDSWGKPAGFVEALRLYTEDLQRSIDSVWKGSVNLMPLNVKLLRKQGLAFQKQASKVWYHLTSRARFKLDPHFAPADNAVAIEDRSGRPGIYLGSDVERWVNGFGYWRPFVVEILVDSSVQDEGGRYGGEMFVPASSFDKLTIQRVIPLDALCREQFHDYGWIESELGREFDTGNPIPERYQERHKALQGYHYNGPDVRNMPMAEAHRLAADLRRVKHT